MSKCSKSILPKTPLVFSNKVCMLIKIQGYPLRFIIIIAYKFLRFCNFVKSMPLWTPLSTTEKNYWGIIVAIKSYCNINAPNHYNWNSIHKMPAGFKKSLFSIQQLQSHLPILFSVFLREYHMIILIRSYTWGSHIFHIFVYRFTDLPTL